MMAIGAYNSECTVEDADSAFEIEKKRIKPFLELYSDNSVKVTYNKMTVYEYIQSSQSH